MSETKNRISLIVHGGAGNIPDEDVAACREGCRKATQAGWKMLQQGASALDTVEAIVNIMEDNPAFDAGHGSFLNTDGEIEMDAIIMDGATLNFGSIASIQRVKNPISVARLVMERTPYVMLAGPGAEAFARSQGIPLCPTEELKRKKSYEQQEIHDLGTVGAIALDCHGNLAVATSTGGMENKMPGRVGDSPIIGSGAYADNTIGAASATGKGEDLMKIIICKSACDLMATGTTAQAAADEIIQSLTRRVDGEGGIILMNPQGEIGWAYNTKRMTCGWVTPDGQILADCHE